MLDEKLIFSNSVLVVMVNFGLAFVGYLLNRMHVKKQKSILLYDSGNGIR